MVFAATLIWSVEFIIAKKVLKTIHPNIVAWARLTIGVFFLLLFLLATGRADTLLSVSLAGWMWSLLTGFILLFFVLTWNHALKRAPATLVTSVLVFASPISTLLDELFVKKNLVDKNAWASLIIIVGVALFAVTLVKNKQKASKRSAEAHAEGSPPTT